MINFFINPIAEGVDTYKCLPVNCDTNGQISDDVQLIGNDIMTRPDKLESGSHPDAFISESDCIMNEDRIHFEVQCDEEGNAETSE